MSDRLLRVRCSRAAGISLDVIDLLLPDEKTAGAGTLIKTEPSTLIWRTHLPDRTEAVVKMYRRRGRVRASGLRLDRLRARREFEAQKTLNLRKMLSRTLCSEPFKPCG